MQGRKMVTCSTQTPPELMPASLCLLAVVQLQPAHCPVGMVGILHSQLELFCCYLCSAVSAQEHAGVRHSL